MPHTLTDDAGTLALVPWAHEGRRSAPGVGVDETSAASLVRRFAASATGLRGLRALLERTRSLLVRELSDEQVSTAIARMVARGELLVVRRRPLDLWVRDGEAEELLPPPSPPVAERPTTWLEIELVDSDGRRVGGELYEVRDADGRTVRGRLDGEGFARVDGLAPGGSVVTFPERDRRDWEGRAVEAVPEGEEEALSWLEIELIDEEGNPVPDEPYVVYEGDRAVARGRLAADGAARIPGLHPGRARVCFPERHAPDLDWLSASAPVAPG